MEDLNQSNGNIISTQDLGNGKKQITVSVDPAKSEGLSIGRGSVMSRYIETPMYQSYTSNDTPYTQALNVPTDPHDKIKLAIQLYFKEPIIGTVIDLMVDFSASGFTNDCEDQEIKKVFDAWGKEIGLQQLLEGIFLEYYRSGNVTIYRSNKDAKVTKSKLKNKKVSDISHYQFPAGYTILNPANVFVYGPLLFNQEVLTLTLDSQSMSFVKNNKMPPALMAQIPDDILKAIRSGSGTITLDPERTTRITRKKQPYERYASPFLERIFEPVVYKEKLRQMDMSTIEGLVNQLVTVTIGNDDFPATDDDLAAIAQLFQTPNKAYTIFWNHTLEVKFHKPEGYDTLTADKYKQVNDDILAGLGVSRVLLDGQGANFSTAWVSILSLIERLENARSKVAAWLESEYKRVAEENDLKSYPTVRFDKMNLREDTYIRDVLLAMYDRGLLDEEDILTETGRDYQAIIETKKRNKSNSELFLPPEQPFQGGQTGNNSGRPGGSGGNYSKRKTGPIQNNGNPPKPKSSKATASYKNLEEAYEIELMQQYNFIQSEIINTLEGNKDKDNTVLEILITATILSLFKTMGQIGKKTILDAFDSELNNYFSGSGGTELKNELAAWNDSYVSKLANDVKSDIIAKIQSGVSVEDSVRASFGSNQYRVTLISQAGILESTRQAKIYGNQLAGAQTATWVAVIDDNTCNTCRGLHGKQFNISNIPPRPHSGCRCDLHFN